MRTRLLLVTFTATIFTSASLLFVVQPMVGKMILPHLGGASSVWTTCMLFFQTMLVLGYVYAHLIAQKLGARSQVLLHGLLIAVAIATTLPFEITGAWIQSRSRPALWLLVALVTSVGLPLFVVSSSAPLFQHWFSFTDHPDADDPYYLYAASNVGSMLALFGYPFVVERFLAVDTQARAWAWGFGALAALTAGCGALVWTGNPQRNGPDASDEADAPDPSVDVADEDGTDRSRPVDWQRRGWWLVVTFIPSSLMLGVTEYLTTDLASVPLLWVLPLGLYLLSFILAFARIPLYLTVFRAVLPVAALVVLTVTYAKLVALTVAVVLHLCLFFALALYFHGRLAEDRPPTRHLTEFYIWMSVGGALGGVFNALIAPLAFDWMIDYYLVLAVGVAVIAPLRVDDHHRTPWTAVAAGITLFATLGLFGWSVDAVSFGPIGTVLASASVVAGIVMLAVVLPRVQNVALAAAILVGSSMYADISNDATYRRSFFAAYTVYPSVEDGIPVRMFSHGNTVHGFQPLDSSMSNQPVGYYHPAGPLGDIFEHIPHEDVAVAGLGTGGMAAYRMPGSHFRFYEIDPTVEAIAREHFTYLDRCGAQCTVEIGDARNLLEQADPDSFDLLLMDAYNSDSVPTHLLTVEAMELYMSRLDDDGVAVFHVSNRYLDVEGVVGRLAEELDLVARTYTYFSLFNASPDLAYSSAYTVVARDEDDLYDLADTERWAPAGTVNVLWTDQFTNLYSVVRW